MRPILVLGGYGNFGKRISKSLAGAGFPVVIGGRSQVKASTLLRTLPGQGHAVATFDVDQDLELHLKRMKPSSVINTCGPFQSADYSIAKACIEEAIPYIDLADARDFVCGITKLDQKANEAGIPVISGASTVPGLSSAVLEEFGGEFSLITLLKFGISPGQKAERGLATTQGILSYVGKPLRRFASVKPNVFGWQDLYLQRYPVIGRRWMANCEIPDLDLLPKAYGIDRIQFSAGLELTPLHLGLWMMSWLVRLGILNNLQKFSGPLLKISNWFNRFGSADGGMHILLDGYDHERKPHQFGWFIVAKNGDGPQIPTIPAIVIAKKIARGDFPVVGAMPCVGLVSLSEYLEELSSFEVSTYRE